MDQNTNQGAQPGGQQSSNPFTDASAQGQGGSSQGINPPADDSSTTPPWLSFSPAGDTPTAIPDSNPFGTTAFTDPIADPATAAQPVNPWEAPAAPTAESAVNPWDSAVVPPTSAPSNPWEAPVDNATPAVTANPWEEAAPVEETPVDTGWQDTPVENTADTSVDDTTSSGYSDDSASKKTSDDLLAELKQRFEEEEGEIDREIQIHEDNIKMEQSAIRELKASRKEQIERMRGMFQELKTILKIDKEEAPQNTNKPRPQHPQAPAAPKPHHPRPQQQPQKERAPQQRPPQNAA
ncbi:MAG: hypothetical protein ACK4NC_04995 [Candidatus Gracilibacteria bacterium]